MKRRAVPARRAAADRRTDGPVNDAGPVKAEKPVNTPEFKESYAVEIVDDEHVLVLSERENQLLTGPAYVAVAQGLAERRSVPEIIRGAPAEVTAAEIFYAVGRLETLGLIREGDGGTPAAVRGFWDSLDVDPATARKAIEQARVTLVGLGANGIDHVASSLAAVGVAIVDEGDFFVVLTDDYLRPDLAALNERFLEQGTRWMLARTTGSIVWLGPVLEPGRSACWECLAHRMRGQRPVETYVQKRKRYSHPRLEANYSLPSTELAAAAMVATETAKWIVKAPERLGSALVTIDLGTLATLEHAVVKRPQCPACGDADRLRNSPPEPVRLVSRAKEFTADGGHRIESPQNTLDRYSHHVSRLTGVVRHLVPSTQIDESVAPVVVSGPNAATVEDTLSSLRGYFRESNGGKGKTQSQAMASALCEAIERHSGIFEGYEYRIRGSHRSLGELAIHPNRCMLYSDRQYANRKTGERFSRAPKPFDENAEVEWSPLWSLTEQRFKYLPTAYCYYDYPMSDEDCFCWADSNGCAGGNSLEEAILQGFFELVERDGVALWWYNRVSRPAVDLESFADPYFAALKDYYRSLSRDLWVLDMTADLGIPTFVAVSARNDVAEEDILVGFGTHIDPRIGIQRALTEVNQFLLVAIDRHSDPTAPFRVSDEQTLAFLRQTSRSACPYLLPSAEPPIAASQYAIQTQEDLRDDVEFCVRAAAARGLETLVLDQTRPDIGLNVVRIVVPGLRHFWARFAPGRLYDIPVDLGWLQAPIAEEELNPIPVVW